MFIFKAYTSLFYILAPGRYQTLYIILQFKQSPVFLLNSRYPLFCVIFYLIILKKRFPLYRSYGKILPSSLNIIILNTLVYSTCLLESVLVRYCFFPVFHKYNKKVKIITSIYKINSLSKLFSLKLRNRIIFLYLKLSVILFLIVFIVTYTNSINFDIFK
jgi:hypothetical protein